MRISDWSSDVCSSDLAPDRRPPRLWRRFLRHRPQRMGPGDALGRALQRKEEHAPVRGSECRSRRLTRREAWSGLSASGPERSHFVRTQGAARYRAALISGTILRKTTDDDK